MKLRRAGRFYQRPTRRRLSGLLMAGLVLGCMAGTALAQQKPAVKYRRIFVPQDEIEEQVRGLLPMRREEFERRLSQATAAGDPLASHSVVRIDEGTYRARLEGDRLVSGTAELIVASEAAGPTLATLAPCSLTVRSARWASRDADSGAERAAILGTNPQGVVQCLVEQPGTLNLSWNLQGTKSATDLIRFDVRLPHAPRTRLEIETPADVELTADRGIVSVSPAANTGGKLWSIELGGLASARLEARRESHRMPDQPLVVARTTANYTVQGSAFDLEASIRLDILRRPIKQLRLSAEAPLTVTSVRLGDTQLGWSVVSEAGEQQPGSILVDLPSELSGVGRAIHVAATGTWPATSRWILPRLSVQDAVFQEGEVTVTAPPWQRLFARPVRGCVQTAVAASGRVAGLDQFQFQLYDDDAQVEIGVNRRAVVLEERSGTQIQIDAAQVTGVMISELTSRGVETFSLEARVPRHWIIDSVETEPADMLAERTVLPPGKSEASQQRLLLSLRRPIAESRPLRVVVRGHFRRLAGEQPLAGKGYRLASFPAARPLRQLVAVRVTDPAVQLDPTAIADSPLLDPQTLAEADLRLFESTPSSIVFEAGPLADELGAALVSAAPRYRADVTLQAMVGQGNVTQTATILCRPESSALQTLLVQVAPRPPRRIAWSIAGEETRELQVEELSDAEPSESGAEGALYRLHLQHPRGAEVQVVGQWSVPIAAERRIPLVWLPEALSQQGLVEIHSLDAAPLNVDASELTPLPTVESQQRLSTLRARFRYEAGRRASLQLRPTAGTERASAWIESLHLTSHFAASGQAQHEARLQMENTGLSQFVVRLPDEAVDVRLVEGTSDRGTVLPRGSRGEFAVPLPRTQRHAEVRIRYASHDRPLWWRPIGSVRAPVPQFDLPVLTRGWTVHVSPRLLALPNAERARAAPSRATHLRESETEFAGWSEHALSLPPGPFALLSVYRPATVAAWTLCIALVAVAAALRSPLRWTMPVTGLLLAGAITAPLPLAWLLGGAAAGALMGMVPLLVQPRKGRAPLVPGETRDQSATTLAAPATSALLAWLCLHGALCSAPFAFGADEARAQVVIPIDDEQKPTGDYVFLSPALYDSLHRLADKGPTALSDWLLERAHYALPAAVQLEGAVPTVTEIEAQFDFHTFQPGTTVQLPLRRRQILLLEGRARLDGQPITPNWLDDGSGLTVKVDSPGRHNLELSFGAGATRDDDDARLLLDVPSAARATVELPAEAVGASVHVGQQSVASDVALGGNVFAIGTSLQLDVRWPWPGQEGERSSMVEGEQLLWWKVRPDSVTLEGRFRLRPLGGPIRTALLTVDPRLRLAPGAAPVSVGRLAVDEQAPQLLRFELAEPASTEFELQLTWLWPGATGAGHLALPQVELHADRMLREWTAISVDPALGLLRNGSEITEPDAAQFVQAWGAAPAAPSAVLSDGRGATRLPLVIRPTESVPQVDESVDWSVSSGHATAHYTARIDNVPRHRFSHRLSSARSLKVTAVELAQGDRPAALRWSQEPDGELNITLLEAPAANQVLHIEAELAATVQRPRLTLPELRLADASRLSSTLRLYRQADALVDLQRSSGWNRQKDMEPGSYREGFGRLVAALERNGEEASQLVIRRSVNAPRLTGSMLVHASEDDGDWWTRVDLALEVTGGVVDELLLSVPDERWSGPISIQPPAEYEWANVPGQSRRHLVVRPAQAVADKLELSIRGSLHGPGTGIQVPDVTVAGHSDIERIVLLGTRTASERIAWETTGLQAIEPAAGSLPPAWHAYSGEWFRVVGAQFNARARPRQMIRGEARLLLAGVQLRLQRSGHAAGRALFIVQPQGQRAALLELPAASRLVQILIDGLPAQARQAGPRTWQVFFPAERVPVRVEIVYDAHVETDAAGHAQLEAPRWPGIEAPQVSWIVEDATGSLAPASAEEQAPRTMLELLKLEAAAKSAEEVAASAAADLPPSTRVAMYRYWKQTCDNAVAQIRGLSDVAPEIDARVERAQQQVRDAGQSLERQNTLPVEATPVAAAPTDPSRATPLYLLTPGSSVKVLRTPLHASRAHSLLLAALAAAFALSAFAATWFVTARWLPRRLASHGPFLLAIAGFALWLLAPVIWAGWLGWLLVATGIWLAWRWPWVRPSHEGGSTIHRLRLE